MSSTTFCSKTKKILLKFVVLMTFELLSLLTGRSSRSNTQGKREGRFQLSSAFFTLPCSPLLTPFSQILTEARTEGSRFLESWFFYCYTHALSSVPCSFPLDSKQGKAKKHWADDLELVALWLSACLRKKGKTKTRHPTTTIKPSVR